MSIENKTFHSFKDFRKEFMEENKEQLKTLKLFHSYGLDVSLESLSDIEILEKKKDSLTYYDKSSKMIITSNLINRVYEKWNDRYSVSLTASNQDKNFFIEHFHSIDPAKTYEQAGLNALKSRKNPETRLLSRAYADVNTKYGDFCLHIEENYSSYKWGPYRSISLYYGNHEQVIIDWKNDFEFNKYGLVRCNHVKQNNFDQFMLGFSNENFSLPHLNIWNYGEIVSSDFPIYAMKDSAKNYSGIILMDGTLKLEENLKYIPTIFDFPNMKSCIKKYEDSDCTSKMYFGNYKCELVTILKLESMIKIEYEKENYEERKFENLFSDSITSLDSEDFTKHDFINIIDSISKSTINSKLKGFVISQLNAYINTHDENNFELLNSYNLAGCNFETMLQYMEQQDLCKLVESGIESLSETLCIGIDEILGENPPNQTKVSQYAKKPTTKPKW